MVQNSSRILAVLPVTISLVTLGADFVAKTDFCKIPCNGTQSENIACKCKKEKNCFQVFKSKTDLVSFRKEMLQHINILRTRLVLGELWASHQLPNASNMVLLNYDVDLEYTAYCQAMSCSFSDNDVCNLSGSYKRVGQTSSTQYKPAGFSKAELEKAIKHSAVSWAKELDKYNVSTLNSYKPIEGTGNITTMLWATLTHIGCVFVLRDVSDVVDFYSIRCNYGSTIEDAPNIAGSPMFKRGPPCSDCPAERECNENAKIICGPVEEVPDDDPYTIITVEENTANALAQCVISESRVYSLVIFMAFLSVIAVVL